MSYSTIRNHPSNKGDYVSVDTDQIDEIGDFSTRLMALLKEGSPWVKTGTFVPKGWVSEAIEFSKVNGYEVKMVQCDDPSDAGGITSTLGMFYFRKAVA